MRAVLGLALVAAMACTPAPLSCAPVSGGEQGVSVQLRGVRFGNDQIAFLFGMRAGGTYGVPAYTIERSGEVMTVRLPGARLRYPDGTPSYLGQRELVPPEGAMRGVTIGEDAAQGVTVSLRVAGAACPRAMDRRYGLGSTHSAALVSVALRDGPALVFDPSGGAPGFPMQVVGLGFGPRAPVTFVSEGRTVWTSRADAKGLLDTIMYVPEVPPGPHRVVVRSPGRTVTSWSTVE